MGSSQSSRLTRRPPAGDEAVEVRFIPSAVPKRLYDVGQDRNDLLVVDGTWEERVQLGQSRAAALRGESIDDGVIDLLLDRDDTAVTYRTAVALLERRDILGVTHVIRACARGDQNAADWLGDAFLRFRADSMGADDAFLKSALAHIADGADELDAAAARELATWLFSG